MKRWFLFSLLVASLSIGLAKSGSSPSDVGRGAPQNNLDTQWGPDAYGYLAKDNNEAGGPPVAFIDITDEGTLVTGLTDDNFVGVFPIGWNFHYYWYNVSQFWVGSNGYIKFSTAGQLAQTFPVIPTSAGPNDVVAPYVADWYFAPGQASECYYWSNDVDTLIVSWVNVLGWLASGNSGNHNFQLILSGVDSSITFQYGTQVDTVSNQNILIGIENVTGQVGIQNFYDQYPTPNSAIKFYYPDVVTYVAHDIGVSGVLNQNSQGAFLLSGGTLNAWLQVRNFGNQNENAFTANFAVRQVNNTLITSGHYNGTPIVPDATQETDFPALWSPSTDGVYRLVGTDTLTGDIYAGNNTVRAELHVVTLPGELAYDDGTAERTWSWSGGEGGMAMEFEPPLYPCEVINARAFIGATGGPFQLQILDDDGPDGSPGTIIWSEDFTDAAPNAWATATVPTEEVIVQNGSFYVAWYTTTGQATTFGVDTTSAQGISRRSWESSGGWAENRLLNEGDPMLRATVRSPGQTNNPPEITAATPDPEELDTVIFNTTVNFAVVAEDPDGQTLTYQWIHNGNNVGTNSPTYNHRFITLNQNTLKCRVCDFEFCDSIQWTPWVRLGTAIGDLPGFVPTDYSVEAFPNPFNPQTTIDFALPQRTEARLVIHNLAGQEVAILQDGVLDAGVHRVQFSGVDLASGTYFAVLTTPKAERITKLLLLK